MKLALVSDITCFTGVISLPYMANDESPDIGKMNLNLFFAEEKVKEPIQKADLIPDIIPDERKPLEPPTGIKDEEYEEDEDPFDDETEKNIFRS